MIRCDTWRQLIEGGIEPSRLFLSHEDALTVAVIRNWQNARRERMREASLYRLFKPLMEKLGIDIYHPDM